jgi:succinoglycan biosynthesis protein ExoM
MADPGSAPPDGPAPGPTALAVCIPTWKRPEWLADLLTAVGALDHPGPDVAVRIVVVDNDEAGSAEATVDAAREGLAWPIDFVVEPARGIANGRNRLVATALAGGADFVAFIDDDEVPEPGWLRELLRVQRATGADIVTGPVPRAYEPGAPAWMVDGGFFGVESRPTGTRMHYAATGNVLIARHVFPPSGEPFSTAFGLNGGEDTHFFERALRQGHVIVWAEDAVATEKVPLSRMNLRWLLRREYRRGNTLSVCLRDLYDSPVRRARRVGQGLYRIAQGAGLLLVGGVRGRKVATDGLLRMYYGAGLLSGLFGHVGFQEYEVVHGT